MPPGFPRKGRRAAALRRVWVQFVGPRLWGILCRIKTHAPGVADRVDRALQFARVWWGRSDPVGASILSVMRATACACESAGPSPEGTQRAYAALFDACVDLLPTPAELAAPENHVRADVAEWCAALRARGWHATQFPSDRIAECPVEIVWTFRDAFMMGPMRSGGSAASAASAAPFQATPGQFTPAAHLTAHAQRMAAPAARAEIYGGGRLCEHVPVATPTSVYAGYDRHDGVFALLHQGWTHKLQPREILRLANALLEGGAQLDRFFAAHARTGAVPSASASKSAPAEVRRALLRRVHVARACLCRWWVYTRLGRWPGDVPLMDWTERILLVRAVDLRAHGSRGNPPHWAPEAADGIQVAPDAPWREWILCESAHDASGSVDQKLRRQTCATGVALAMQAVVIESVRRLAPLQWYLKNHSRWSEFETESIRARNQWRRVPLDRRHEHEPPAFFSYLMTLASRDTDPHMWLVHVGRCLRSRGIVAAPLSDSVERAFRMGIAALPELARVVWPIVMATREAAEAEAATEAAGKRPGKPGYAMRQIQCYVGRLAPDGSVRFEWDLRVPPATMAYAIALAEVYGAALKASGVDAAACSDVFRAVRDLYVCTTGPRVQATALVAQLEATHPRLLPLLVALHNVCVDRLTLRTLPLDAHTASMQRSAVESLSISAGRADWLMVCHQCTRPHSIVVEFNSRARAAFYLARHGFIVPHAAGSASASAKACAAAIAAATGHAGGAPSTARRGARSASSAVSRGAGDAAVALGGADFFPLPVTDHGYDDVSIDVHDMAYLCDVRKDGRREPIYPLKMAGLLVCFRARTYTVCPQCARPAQINPQQCEFVNGTFACARCSGQVERIRSRGIVIPA